MSMVHWLARRASPKIQNAVTPECSLWEILLSHPNMMVPRTQVYFREVIGSSKLIHQHVNARNQVLILQSLLLQGLVINAHIEGLILLFHQHHKRREGIRIEPDVPQSQQLLYGLLNLILV